MSETCIQASDICEIFPRFQVYFIRHRSHTCWFLYEVLLPTLQSADLPASGAGNTTPQRAGTSWDMLCQMHVFGLADATGRARCVQSCSKKNHVQLSIFLFGEDGGRFGPHSTTSRCRCQVDHQRSDHVDGGTETGRTPLCQRH